jgi:shikimate kinase
VIAAAASVIEDPCARELLREPYVVLLDGPPPVLADRMFSGGHRPHLSADLVAMLTDQRDRRLPLFRAVANAVFDVSTTAPADIAAAVVAATHDGIQAVADLLDAGG